MERLKGAVLHELERRDNFLNLKSACFKHGKGRKGNFSGGAEISQHRACETERRQRLGADCGDAQRGLGSVESGGTAPLLTTPTAARVLAGERLDSTLSEVFPNLIHSVTP